MVASGDGARRFSVGTARAFIFLFPLKARKMLQEDSACASVARVSLRNFVSKFAKRCSFVHGICVHETRTLAHSEDASNTQSRTHMPVRVGSPMAACCTISSFTCRGTQTVERYYHGNAQSKNVDVQVRAATTRRTH